MIAESKNGPETLGPSGWHLFASNTSFTPLNRQRMPGTLSLLGKGAFSARPGTNRCTGQRQSKRSEMHVEFRKWAENEDGGSSLFGTSSEIEMLKCALEEMPKLRRTADTSSPLCRPP